MRQDEGACWTLIHAAAAGSARERETFARTYEPVVRAYLGIRWRGRTDLLREMGDPVQGGEAAEKRVRLLHLRFREGLPIRNITKRWDTDVARECERLLELVR